MLSAPCWRAAEAGLTCPASCPVPVSPLPLCAGVVCVAEIHTHTHTQQHRTHTAHHKHTHTHTQPRTHRGSRLSPLSPSHPPSLTHTTKPPVLLAPKQPPWLRVS